MKGKVILLPQGSRRGRSRKQKNVVGLWIEERNWLWIFMNGPDITARYGVFTIGGRVLAEVEVPDEIIDRAVALADAQKELNLLGGDFRELVFRQGANSDDRETQTPEEEGSQ